MTSPSIDPALELHFERTYGREVREAAQAARDAAKAAQEAARAAQAAASAATAAQAAYSAAISDLRLLGIDGDAASLRAISEDLSWIRQTREGSGKIGLSIKTTLICSIATAILALVWSALPFVPPTP